MVKSRKKNKKIEPPQIVHGGKRSGWFVIILAAAGLGICLYLYSLHVALLMDEIKSGPLSSADGGLGCQSVASGPYSSMMVLPLASWGAIFYNALAMLGFGGVIFWRDSGRVYLRWVFCLTVLGLVFDLYFAW
ncbi:vitamin K epoxide reductase family protein [Thermodesulfobacteriota bacterium]